MKKILIYTMESSLQYTKEKLKKTLISEHLAPQEHVHYLFKLLDEGGQTEIEQVENFVSTMQKARDQLLLEYYQKVVHAYKKVNLHLDTIHQRADKKSTLHQGEELLSQL